MGKYDDPAHGANKVRGGSRKRGENKGIAAARKAVKRAEAYARNGKEG